MADGRGDEYEKDCRAKSAYLGTYIGIYGVLIDQNRATPRAGQQVVHCDNVSRCVLVFTHC